MNDLNYQNESKIDLNFLNLYRCSLKLESREAWVIWDIGSNNINSQPLDDRSKLLKPLMEHPTVEGNIERDLMCVCVFVIHVSFSYSCVWI